MKTIHIIARTQFTYRLITIHLSLEHRPHTTCVTGSQTVNLFLSLNRPCPHTTLQLTLCCVYVLAIQPTLVASRYIPSWLPVDSVSDELESPQPSTSTVTTPTSATKRKFSYRQGLPLRERMSAADRRRQPVETSFVRCCMMSTLVKGLLCLECSAPTLKIRAIDRRLGLMCMYETYCTTCGVVLNSTLSSDRTDKERAGNVPFVVVGHAGLVKLCRFMAEASTKTA